VAPSLAISILFLRAYEKVSFVEAVDRTKYDLRWKVALGLEMEEVPMQKSTLQEFEAKLVLHKRGEALLKKSIDEARRAGYLQSRKIRVALDTTPILGKGAVKDTYNLLAEGIEQLACRLAELEGETAAAWAERQGLRRYFGSSLKGEAAIDWDDKKQREQLLTAIVQDARRLLGGAEQAQADHPEQAETIAAAARLAAALDRSGCGRETGGRLPDQNGDGEGPAGECGGPGDAARAQECEEALQWAQGSAGGGPGESVDHGSRSAGGQCRRPGESAGLSAPERAGDGSRGGRNGGRLCLRRWADAARLCRRRA
jgi:hypothetical protein